MLAIETATVKNVETNEVIILTREFSVTAPVVFRGDACLSLRKKVTALINAASLFSKFVDSDNVYSVRSSLEEIQAIQNTTSLNCIEVDPNLVNNQSSKNSDLVKSDTSLINEHIIENIDNLDIKGLRTMARQLQDEIKGGLLVGEKYDQEYRYIKHKLALSLIASEPSILDEMISEFK